ncbi:DUF4874 domain-containing protein [Kribbella sp. NPDC020789]
MQYKNGPIAQAALDQLQQQIDTVRAAGLKMVLRFAYTTSTTGDDAAKDRVLGNAGSVGTTDWANRKAVTDKLLSVVPPSRMVQLRTPKFKRTMYTTTPVQSANAYNGSATSRIGHHNWEASTGMNSLLHTITIS